MKADSSLLLVVALLACGGDESRPRQQTTETCPTDTGSTADVDTSSVPGPTTSSGTPPTETGSPDTSASDTAGATPAPCQMEWALHLGSTAVDDLTGAALAPDGTIVVGGYFSRDMVLGAGEPNETTLTPYCGGMDSPFLAKYATDGTLVWATRAADGCDEVRITALAVEADGHLVVGGWYDDEVTFGAGLAQENTLRAPPSNVFELFLARYDAAGLFEWAVPIGGPSMKDEISDLAIGDDGTIYATGEYEVSMTFGTTAGADVIVPGPPEDVLGDPEAEEMWLAAYDPAGVPRWAERAGGPADDQIGYGVAALAAGPVLTGSFGSDIVFDPGEPNETLLASAGGPMTPLGAYGSDGTLAWAKLEGGASGSDLVAVDAGSFLVTGATGTAARAVFGAGTPTETVLATDVFYLARYDASGALLWARGAIDGPEGGFSYGIHAAAGTDVVAVAGRFDEEIVFDGGPTFLGPYVGTFIDDEDAFAAAYTLDGDFLCAWGMSGPGDANATSVVVDEDGGTVVGGWFYDQLTLEAGTPQETTFSSSYASKDLFLARFVP